MASETHLRKKVARIFQGVTQRTLDVSKFEDRFLLQKTMLLAQRAGAKLNLRFTPYLYGPYSSELAHVAYGLTPADYSGDLEPDEARAVGLVREKFGIRIDGYDSKYLELLTTVAYFMDGSSDEELFQRTIEQKPWAKEDEVFEMKEVLSSLSQ
jgi:hypothetical protein